MSAMLIFVVFWAAVIAVGVGMVAQDIHDRRRDDDFYRRWQSRRPVLAGRGRPTGMEERRVPAVSSASPNVPKLRKVA